MSKLLGRFNLILRGCMEFGIIAAMGYWGYHTGTSILVKIILCIVSPLLVFGFWGLVDFRNTGTLSEYFRLIQELFLSGFSAVALYFTGQHILGWLLGILSIIHHALVYILGDTLLK